MKIIFILFAEVFLVVNFIDLWFPKEGIHSFLNGNSTFEWKLDENTTFFHISTIVTNFLLIQLMRVQCVSDQNLLVIIIYFEKKKEYLRATH